jgi:hypothetical protein
MLYVPNLYVDQKGYFQHLGGHRGSFCHCPVTVLLFCLSGGGIWALLTYTDSHHWFARRTFLTGFNEVSLRSSP